MLAAGLALTWLLMLYVTGSFVGGTALLLLLMVLGICCVVGLRSAGIGPGHPWVRRLATRPWRDGQDVLRLSMRHLPDVFVTTPSGTLLAPNSVEVRLNPGDYDVLIQRMDPDLLGQSATEVYVDQVAERGARFTGSGAAEVRVVADHSIPEGRFIVRQGRPLPQGAPMPMPVMASAAPVGAAVPMGASAAPVDVRPPRPAGASADGPRHVPGPGAGFRFAHDGGTRTEATLAPVAGAVGTPTMAEPREPSIPPLHLITGDQVAQTSTSGARAGRGSVELVLPQVPTISREHARFTFADGQWWVTNLGRNGLTLNGVQVAGDHPVCNGDSIRWGGNRDALMSRVKIG
jgi:hypothetical protein